MPLSDEERRARNREKAARWRQAHPEQARASWKRYRTSSQGRAKRAQYRRSPEGHAKNLVEQRANGPARVRRWRQNHPEEARIQDREKATRWRQRHPEKARAAQAEQKRNGNAAASSTRYRTRHPEQVAVARHMYAKTHPEYFRAKAKERSARKRGATHNDLADAQWAEIKAAYDHRCVYCGRKMEKLTQDHIVPLIKGGAHTASNIVPACQSCNSRKHTGSPLCPVQPLLLTLAPARKPKKAS